MALTDTQYRSLTDTRVNEPEAIAAAYAARQRPASLAPGGMTFIVAADHTARGMVSLGSDTYAMADRRSMLNRLTTALAHPRVDGVLASADIMDDLVLLGVLEGKIAVGTMNRGGLAGASWELDDRFTAYDPEHLVRRRLDAGKMLLRIDNTDAGTVPTLHACARAVQALDDAGLMAMVEPIPYTKDASGKAVWDHDPYQLVRAVGVCAGFGASSARTWLKIQATADIARVAAMTTQPLLLLGGAPGPDPEATFAQWERALSEQTVRGLVVGRALLYPPDGDVAAAVDRAWRVGHERCAGPPMTSHPWYRPAPAPSVSERVRVTPADAGWRFAGLDVWAMSAGERRTVDTAGIERAVLPLSGAYVVEVDGAVLELDGRADVFAKVTDWAYVPPGSAVILTAVTGGEVALPSAPAEARFPAVRVGAQDVTIEVRGAGPATRQVTNFMSPGVFDGAQRLMCVELLTPDGNWSSYPPHRHDGIGECVVNNEEIYYFRIGTTASSGYAADGFGMHRTYTVEGDVDVNLAVRDGDVFLIPRGYHGPCVAAPGYPMYYLNVLAGPGPERTMAFCDDPTHHWVRDSWASMEPDPRVPMTDAAGRLAAGLRGGEADG